MSTEEHVRFACLARSRLPDNSRLPDITLGVDLTLYMSTSRATLIPSTEILPNAKSEC